jgi:hypothetical protein
MAVALHSSDIAKWSWRRFWFGPAGTGCALAGIVRQLLALVCVLAATACTESPTGPAVPLDTGFTLSPGESRAIEGTTLTIRFNGVTGDSRCPADAVCIQGGSAEVRITAASDASTRDLVLMTGDMRPVQHGPFTIALVQLAPYPFSSRTIPPEDYRATLRVTR